MKIKTIGMVINTALKPSRDVMRGVMDCIREFPDARPRLFHANAATQPQHIIDFVLSGVDGLIFTGVREDIAVKFGRKMPNHPPVVLCAYAPLTHAERKFLGNCGTVMIDNEAIGKQAARFFYNHGLQNFAFFGSNVYRERIAGNIRCVAFRKHLTEQFGEQIKFSSLMVGRAYDNEDYWDSDEREIEAWVKSLPLPCGILANGDREAFGLVDICNRLGIVVPGKIEVLGINNAHGLCEMSKPAISSIDPDLQTCSREVVKMAMALIGGQELPPEQRDIRVKSRRLVERGTTLSGCGYDQVVTRAREFIRLHACEGIGVGDVSRGLCIPLRTLEARIHESTGSGIHAMIRSMRLQRVCELLKTTDLPIGEVTTRAGYRLTTSLGGIFKKAYGMSMRQYRSAYGQY